MFVLGVVVATLTWKVLLRYADRSDHDEFGAFEPVDAAASPEASTHPKPVLFDQDDEFPEFGPLDKETAALLKRAQLRQIVWGDER